MSGTTLGSAKPSMQWVSGVFWWESGRGGELITYLPATTAEVKNECSYIRAARLYLNSVNRDVP